jgi:uncharacterized OB-fold protein
MKTKQKKGRKQLTIPVIQTHGKSTGLAQVQDCAKDLDTRKSGTKVQRDTDSDECLCHVLY